MDVASPIRQAYEFRTNRVIATCRVVFACLFVSFLAIDSAQPARSNDFGVLLLWCYAAFSLAALVIAWRSWWLDYLLAKPALGIDVFVFLTAVFFTENAMSNFVSPFLSFFAFLMLSANSRWGWRATAWTALVIVVAFFVVGFDLHHLGFKIDLSRFTRRIAYMSVMSLVLVWFGAQNIGMRVPRFIVNDEAIALLIDDALGYAMRTLGASQGALAWADDEEPRIFVKSVGPEAEHQAYYPLDAVNLLQPHDPVLFDARHSRELALAEDGRIAARLNVRTPGTAEAAALTEGLCVPLSGTTGNGQFVLSGINGMSPDHLRVGQEIGREISLAMDRQQLAKVTNEAAMMRLRSSIARDLHDSLAQSLAGANFRLQGLRTLIQTGADPLPEIEAIQAGLSGEQAQVRAMIQRLRREEIAPGERDVTHEIRQLVPQLERKWGISIHFVDNPEPLSVPALLVFEVQQLIREGVANAVRHGQASAIEVGLARLRHELVLTVSDNGNGFPVETPTVAPRTLTERIGDLGGSLVISTREGNTRITMTLPIRGRT